MKPDSTTLFPHSIIEVVDLTSLSVATSVPNVAAVRPATGKLAAEAPGRQDFSLTGNNVEWAGAVGGTDAQVKEIEELIGHRLPDDYYQFIRSHGGATPSPDGFRFLQGDTWIEDSVQQFLAVGDNNENSLRDAFVEVRNTVEDEYGEEDLDHVLLPIAKDYNFNWICLVLGGINHGHIVFFDHEGGYEEHLCEKIISKTFESFVASLQPRSDV